MLSLKIEQVEEHLRGSTMKHINKGDFEDLKIPLPPLETQKKIAAVLNKADALRQKRRQTIDKLDELTQSVFLDMFGDPALNSKEWETQLLEKSFANIDNPTRCGPFGSALKKDEYTEEGVPVWNMDNIVNGRFVTEGAYFIPEKKFKDLESYKVNKGDIIISRAGTVGKMCVIDKEIDKSIISTNLIKLSLDENQIDPYFFAFLMSHFGKRVARLKTGQEDAFTHMSTKVLKTIELPVPPNDLQKEFTNFVKKTDQQKAALETSLQKIIDLKNAIILKAFKGELNFRDNDEPLLAAEENEEYVAQ